MTEKNEPSKIEEPVARVTISADAGFLPPLVDFVRETAHRLGLLDEAAEHLDRVVEVICRNVVEHAFEPGNDGRYDVLVLRRPGQVVVAVEDQGLPFDYECFKDGDSVLSEMVHRSFANEVRFLNLGRGGNRVELIKDLPHADVRDHLSEDEHRETVEAPVASRDAPLDIRMMRPEESPALSRAVYRSYGYSYDWDDIYYPDRIRELQESGLMRSCVAVSHESEFVGHLALMAERPDPPVAEAGQAVVDPRFRGHQLFAKMKTFLAERATGEGMYGLYSEATAVHPYSQKGNLHLGARETGFLLGYIPPSVSYKDIGEDRAGRRGSVALFYMRTSEEPEREIYPPARYRNTVRRVVEHNGLRRAIVEVPASRPEAPASSRVDVCVRQDHNLAFLRVAEPGNDLRELVRSRLRELCLHRIDVIYVDLPLSNPATRIGGDRLEELGFFFGGIIPEARDGDVLRLQYLNNVEVEKEDISIASDFGGELLGLIFEQRDALG
ncbi:MAG: ATP-binding protein [Actinobacteria bacterium]|nr:ATP-binding protein [Actinomycetota bacterium]MCA1737483.1 ATP-binding protein [Actinomycetota bacterium]